MIVSIATMAASQYDEISSSPDWNLIIGRDCQTKHTRVIHNFVAEALKEMPNMSTNYCCLNWAELRALEYRFFAIWLIRSRYGQSPPIYLL